MAAKTMASDLMLSVHSVWGRLPVRKNVSISRSPPWKPVAFIFGTGILTARVPRPERTSPRGAFSASYSSVPRSPMTRQSPFQAVGKPSAHQEPR